MMNLFLLASMTGAYLIGSLCSAIIVCQLFRLPDPRHSGSNNPGATNVLRIAGKGYALVVFILDALKGTLPVLVARLYQVDDLTLGWIALAAVLGHIYPLYFHFQGGKGVATALGALLGFHPLLAASVLATWVVVAVLTRYSSLASLIALGSMPIYAGLEGNFSAELPLCIMTMIVWFQHRANWTRLCKGTESKIKT